MIIEFFEIVISFTRINLHLLINQILAILSLIAAVTRIPKSSGRNGYYPLCLYILTIVVKSILYDKAKVRFNYQEKYSPGLLINKVIH